MKSLLDTNICIGILNSRDPVLKQKLTAKPPSDFVLCSVVKAELIYGARKSQKVESNLQLLQDFFGIFESLPFDDEAATHYGVLRTTLEKAGTPIGASDLMIASIALAYDLVLITRNQREFLRVPALRVESW